MVPKLSYSSRLIFQRFVGNSSLYFRFSTKKKLVLATAVPCFLTSVQTKCKPMKTFLRPSDLKNNQPTSSESPFSLAAFLHPPVCPQQVWEVRGERQRRAAQRYRKPADWAVSVCVKCLFRRLPTQYNHLIVSSKACECAYFRVNVKITTAKDVDTIRRVQHMNGLCLML